MQLCSACRRHVKVSPCPFCGESTLVGAGVLLALAALSVGCSEPAPKPTDAKPDPQAESAPAATLDAGVNPRFHATAPAGGYGAAPSTSK